MPIEVLKNNYWEKMGRFYSLLIYPRDSWNEKKIQDLLDFNQKMGKTVAAKLVLTFQHPCRIYRPFFLNYRPFLKVAGICIQMTLCTQIKFLMKQNLWIHASPTQKCQLILEFLGGLLWENSDKLWMLISSNISFY